LKLIGLTGGAGSGKSTVAEMFRELGAVVLDADEAAHAVYEPGTPGFRAVVDAFGSDYVRDGRIDRAKLGELVFSNAGPRAILNEIVHPRVREWMAERTGEAVARGAEIVIHDVPLLFENDLQGLYWKTILVYADPATQLSRLTQQRGLSLARATSMVASQMSIDEKRPLADYEIDNDGSLEDTRRQVDDVWTRVRSL
jgi:dephospho-CoA kinase